MIRVVATVYLLAAATFAACGDNTPNVSDGGPIDAPVDGGDENLYGEPCEGPPPAGYTVFRICHRDGAAWGDDIGMCVPEDGQWHCRRPCSTVVIPQHLQCAEHGGVDTDVTYADAKTCVCEPP